MTGAAAGFSEEEVGRMMANDRKIFPNYLCFKIQQVIFKTGETLERPLEGFRGPTESKRLG